MALNLKIIVVAIVIIVVIAVVVGYSRFKGRTEVSAPETIDTGQESPTEPPAPPKLPQINDSGKTNETTTPAKPPKTNGQDESTNPPAPGKPPQTTSNTSKTIDDTINLFLQNASSDTTSIINEGNSDANIVSTDSQTISDFSKVYDENEF